MKIYLLVLLLIPLLFFACKQCQPNEAYQEAYTLEKRLAQVEKQRAELSSSVATRLAVLNNHAEYKSLAITLDSICTLFLRPVPSDSDRNFDDAAVQSLYEGYYAIIDQTLIRAAVPQVLKARLKDSLLNGVIYKDHDARMLSCFRAQVAANELRSMNVLIAQLSSFNTIATSQKAILVKGDSDHVSVGDTFYLTLDVIRYVTDSDASLDHLLLQRNGRTVHIPIHRISYGGVNRLTFLPPGKGQYTLSSNLCAHARIWTFKTTFEVTGR